MDATFWPRRALQSIGIVWLGIIARNTVANAEPDFSGVSDVDLLLHEDREEAMEEYKLRTKDYTPQQVWEIEAEFFRQVRMPREEVEPTVEELLAKINQADDILKRMKPFTALHERYEVADASEKGEIREAFLAAWDQVPYPTTYEDDENDNMSRYRDYAYQASLYFPTEEELIPILKERCLNIEAADRQSLFIGELVRTKVQLGAVSAVLMEQLYNEMKVERANRFATDREYATLAELHQVLGRCGKPGFETLLRMGTAEREYGVLALQINNTPEAEALLWKMYEETSADHDRTRLHLLRAIGSKGGTVEERAARCARVRPELERYLQMPEGKIDLWAVQDAVSLAKDSKDPYYLPYVMTLETSLFRADRSNYECSGMEDRMEEALAMLQESFDNAKLKLSEVDTIIPE